jgi:hypothetical protein
MFRIVFWDVLLIVGNHFTRQYIPEDNSEHYTNCCFSHYGLHISVHDESYYRMPSTVRWLLTCSPSGVCAWFEYTVLLKNPRKNKSGGLRTGDLGGHNPFKISCPWSTRQCPRWVAFLFEHPYCTWYFRFFIALMMEAVCISETSVSFNETTRHYIPEDCQYVYPYYAAQLIHTTHYPPCT